MQQVDKQILCTALFMGFCGLLYFPGLVGGLPLWLLWIVLGAAMIWLVWPRKEDTHTVVAEKRASGWPAWLFLTAGMALITNRCYHVAEVYGGWDAWAMWNYKARAMTDPRYWHIFMKPGAPQHSDYPLMVPGINALFLRTFGAAATELVPYVLALAITLLMPVWIFARVAPLHLPVATAILLLFATSDTYLFEGVSQYADVWVSFFFLAALLAHQDAVKGDNQAALWQKGFFTGCCLWTKNEGLILAVLATAFWLPALRRRGGLRRYVAGAALPVLVWTLFKTGWPMPGDMLPAGPDHSILKMLADGSRYAAIWKGLQELMTGPYFWVQVIFWVTTGVCLIKKVLPKPSFFLVLTALLAYNAIYLITPHDIGWHLATSQSRLVFQLVPAFVYASLETLLAVNARASATVLSSISAGTDG